MTPGLSAISKGLFKRHTTATIAATTYAEGEPVWDTDLNLLRVGDGSTAGGILAAPFGGLGATAYVVASNAPASTLASAAILQANGYPVWLCDGTADDVEIQAAIDAIQSLAVGGSIRLTSGNFYISSTITLKSWCKTFIGDGVGSTMIYLSDGSDCDMITTGTTALYDVEIADMLLDGNKDNNSSGNGIYMVANRSHLHHLFIKSCKENGIYFPTAGSGLSQVVYVDNIKVYNMDAAGIYNKGCTDCFYTSVDVATCATYGMQFEAAIQQVNSCHLSAMTEACILIRNRGVQITSCQLENNYKEAILLQSTVSGGAYTYYCAHPIISNNYFWDNSRASEGTYSVIKLQIDGEVGFNAYLPNAVIVGNSTNKQSKVASKYFVEITGSYNHANHLVLTGNSISNCNSGGFISSATMNSPIITNNSVVCYAYVSEIRPTIAGTLDLLGANLSALWPMAEVTGTTIQDYSPNNHDLTAAQSVASWDTAPAFKGRSTYYTFSNSADEYLYTADHADFTTADAFCVGAWVSFRNTTTGSDQTIVAKWDETTGAEAREFRLYIDGTGYPSFEVYDETNDAYVGREAQTALTANTWYFILAVFDGGADAANIDIYVNGVKVDDADIADEAGFANVTDTAAEVGLGYIEGTDGALTDYIGGSLTWVFYAKTDLAAYQAWQLYQEQAALMGV